jgi:hypothetical protein
MSVLVSALGLNANVLQAQDTNEVEQLKKQLRQIQENFDQVMREQQAQIDLLRKQLEATKTNAPAPAIAPPPEATPASEPTEALAKPWTPSQPITLAGNSRNYINLSFDALVAAGGSTAEDIEGGTQLGGHDPKQRGFTVQNLETVFDGKVDPYFRGQANIVLQLDPEGETTIEAEEAYLETLSLPWNLQVKAGQFFTEFGRLNPVHPHAWDFVDQPLVNGRFLGEDGLRNPGARVSWLMPTPFYSELFLAVQNSQGETAFSFRDSHEEEPLYGRLHSQNSVKALDAMLFVPRYVVSFNLTDSQTLVAGASAAFGPNGSGTDVDTQIYGVDLFWKWKSPNHHGGFPFVTWQTEAMLRRYQAAASTTVDLDEDGIEDSVPRETLTDYGFYSQIAYGFKKGWVAALRGDWVSSDKGQYEKNFDRDPARAPRWRISPNLTYYPSEFSKIRLQYNYDDRELIGEDHSVWLQFEFLLGSHAAHKF